MADKNNSARIEDFLKQVRKLKEQHEKRAAVTGEDFNVFEILGVERREVKHSAMLANLLNPKGSHRQGTVFLEHFLNLELLGQGDSASYGELGDFQVVAEVTTNANDGRIDIRLQKKGYACIIIENKIDAEDGDGQLNKYYMDAKEEGFTDEQIKLIYLTLYGEPPSEKALDGQKPLDADRVICISYESHIIKWLEDCFKEVVGIARLQDALLQYQGLIKKLLKQPKELTMEISDVLIRKYDLITELENSVTEAKKRIQAQFFEKLKEKITEVCGIEKWSSVPGGIGAKVPKFDLDLPFTM